MKTTLARAASYEAKVSRLMFDAAKSLVRKNVGAVLTVLGVTGLGVAISDDRIAIMAVSAASLVAYMAWLRVTIPAELDAQATVRRRWQQLGNALEQRLMEAGELLTHPIEPGAGEAAWVADFAGWNERMATILVSLPDNERAAYETLLLIERTAYQYLQEPHEQFTLGRSILSRSITKIRRMMDRAYIRAEPRQNNTCGSALRSRQATGSA